MNLCKKEQLHILKQLLGIEFVLNYCKRTIEDINKSIAMSDDGERYLKMAMKINPNDPAVLDW